MITVLRTPEIDRAWGLSAVANLEGFACRLSDTDEVRHVDVTAFGPRDLADSDVVVFAARVHSSGLEATAEKALEAFSQCNLLAGKVGFCVLLGDSPAEFASQYERIANGVGRAGAIVFAPAFTFVLGQPDYQAAVEKFCKYWAPSLPELRQIAASIKAKDVAA